MEDQSVIDELKSLERVYDRLTTTSNEDLSNVLSKLLPKLLPLMNKELLRPTILKILANVTKRVKMLGTVLPCSDLIPLVHESYKPFCCNFAAVLIDLGLLHESSTAKVNCAASLAKTLDQTTPNCRFTNIDNSLFAYSSVLLPEISTILSSPDTKYLQVPHLLCDWFLDIALHPTFSGSPATNSIIYPGLSPRRLERIREKNDTPVKLQIIASKLLIISFLHEKWLYVSSLLLRLP